MPASNSILSSSCTGLTCRTLISILILVPIRQHICNPRRVRQPVNLLKVLLCQLKRFCSDVRNIFPNKLGRVDSGLVDLLEQERPEGLDTGAEERAVERHIDSLERDGCKTTLQRERLRLCLCLFGAFMDDVHEMGFDIVKRHLLHESLDVDVLSPKHVEEIRQAVKRA